MRKREILGASNPAKIQMQMRIIRIWKFLSWLRRFVKFAEISWRFAIVKFPRDGDTYQKWRKCISIIMALSRSLSVSMSGWYPSTWGEFKVQ